MSSEPAESDELAKAWREKPRIIRRFIEMIPHYDQLCSEVAYILEKAMAKSVIEYSAITYRAKTLKSFSEKLVRKEYEDPLGDITDFAGVRLVFLYKSDRSKIEEIVESEFTVVEKIDKVEEQEADRFGYGALHYLVHLGRKSSGARYDDLKSLICEIQVRTVLQDAWAIIDHHLIYKQESEIPKPLKRKINSISGLFETADEQFDQIRAQRESYRKEIKKKLDSKGISLDQELNLDTFSEYLKWKYPNMSVARDDTQISVVLSKTLELGHRKLSELDGLLSRTQAARDALALTFDRERTAATEVARALIFEYEALQHDKDWTPEKDAPEYERQRRLLIR
jgi:putative GTP pyrophosphokinase